MTYPEGTRVRVTYEAVVAGGRDADGNRLIPLDRRGNDGTLWWEIIEDVTIERLSPPGWPEKLSPGIITSAGGVLWVLRRSNRRDSLRAMPVDLSGKLRTLAIENFFEKYPRARVLFNPEQPPLAPLADWERDLLEGKDLGPVDKAQS